MWTRRLITDQHVNGAMNEKNFREKNVFLKEKCKYNQNGLIYPEKL